MTRCTPLKGSRWQLIAASVLLLLWIVFLACDGNLRLGSVARLASRDAASRSILTMDDYSNDCS